MKRRIRTRFLLALAFALGALLGYWVSRETSRPCINLVVTSNDTDTRPIHQRRTSMSVAELSKYGELLGVRDPDDAPELAYPHPEIDQAALGDGWHV